MLDSENSYACYAVTENRSHGRIHSEVRPNFRGEYQRDRDRIIHSSAFRRLIYKTQVFVNHEGDLYRTRLTHSIEVSQISRTIAQALSLNETLIEAIALAHDLGHTPFGHAGQDTLNKCMQNEGGFEHNFQSLRVVDQLEARYAEFDGLNLTFETREGILKHCSARNAKKLGMVGERFLNRTQPSLEAQLVNIADAIAYNHHDIDDGVRAGLLSLEQLNEISLFRKSFNFIKLKYPHCDDKRLLHESLRHMINAVINDLITNTKLMLNNLNPSSIEDIRKNNSVITKFSDDFESEHIKMKQFLNSNLYKHAKVIEMTERAEFMINKIFESYASNERSLPESFNHINREPKQANKIRAICDYIAGMTDRFAIAEYERLIKL